LSRLSDHAYDLAGVVHVHSLYSDGTGTVPEIAAAAEANGLDFVLLTDHDTLEARSRSEEGWYGHVLLLAGEEVSPWRENHYLAFGLDEPIDHTGLAPREIIERVENAGGFGFLSHPFSKGSDRFRRGAGGMPWRDLDAPGYTGLELWSFVTDTGERLTSIADLVRFIAAPARFVDHPPRANLEGWDRICRDRRCVALGGIDAHQLGVRIRNRVPLRLMSYRRSFRFLHTHVLVPEPPRRDLERDRAALFEALRGGHAYLAMDSIAPARGFRFRAAGGDGSLAMGDEARAGSERRTFEAEVPRAARISLLCNGRPVAGTDHGVTLHHEASGPGVYRVEAYLHAHGRERTWIVSNPIYLR
jgi:hypothetical protein